VTSEEKKFSAQRTGGGGTVDEIRTKTKKEIRKRVDQNLRKVGLTVRMSFEKDKQVGLLRTVMVFRELAVRFLSVDE